VLPYLARAGPCEVFASVQDALNRAGVRHQAGYTAEVFSSSRTLTDLALALVEFLPGGSFMNAVARVSTVLLTLTVLGFAGIAGTVRSSARAEDGETPTREESS